LETKIVHSEPVREIMGTPPRALVAWGTTVLFIIFTLFILAAWFIKYPDVVPAQIEITSRIPPVTFFARSSGRLVMLNVNDRQQVIKGEILAAIESPADHIAVLALGKLLSDTANPVIASAETIGSYQNLGEIQEPFNLYRQSLSRLANYRTNDYLGNRIRALGEEIAAGKQYLSSLRNKEKLYQEDIRLQQSSLSRDSLLFRQGAVTAAAFEKSQQLFLARRIELQQINLDILAESISLNRREQDLRDLAIKREEETQILNDELSASFAALNAAIETWKNRYLFAAPVDGTVVFLKFLSPQQFVAENEAVMTLMPATSGEPFGMIMLPMQRSGKVKEGMEVNIKLGGFPFLEYGTVKGRVGTISPVADGKSYLVEIILPDRLLTNYGEQLPLTQNMSGLAEIITDDHNLLSKIINPLRYLIIRNSQKE